MPRPNTFLQFVLCAAFVLAIAQQGNAQQLRNPQSRARPLGYQPVGPVHKSASDSRSRQFNRDYLPKVMRLVNEKFREGKEFQNPEAVPINVDRMMLNYDYDVRAYFIHEGAGYKNAVGYRAGNDHKLLFPDCSYDGARGVRLKRGDFVKLGTVKKGTKFDLMLIPNGGNGGLGGRYYRLYTTSSLSDDKRQHFVGFWIEDTPLLLFGAEDLLGGGDNDFEDVVIVMDFGLDYDPQKYYVSKRGNDDNDGRSLRTAFQTISKAASVVKPGDTVYVNSGAYKETIQLRQRGTALHPIRFIARGNVTVLPPAKNSWSAMMYYADHTVFDGFRFSGANVPHENGSYAYGLYNYHSDVTFKNCEFERLAYTLYGVYSGVEVENCNFHDNYWYSIWNQYGGVKIDKTIFRNNNHGPYSYRDHSFVMTNSEITDNRGWALLYSFKPYGTHKPFGTAKPSVTNCTIKNNQQGLYLAYAEDDDRIRFQRTKFERTKSWEIGLVHCDLKVTPRWRQQWPIERGGSGLYSYASKLDMRGMTFEGYENGWGMIDYHSELTMQDVNIRKNHQGMQTFAPAKFTAKNCNFDDNKYWGFLLYNHGDGAVAELDDCSIQHNSYGAYFYRANKANLKLHNTVIANNSSHGLYLSNSDAEFSPRTMGRRWRLHSNGHNITTYYGKTLFDSVTMSDAKYWGALTYYGDVEVRNCTFTKNGHGGFWSYFNKSFAALNSKFDGNGYYGLAYSSNGRYYGYNAASEKWGWWRATGPGQVANCSIADNKFYGIYLYYTTANTLQMSNTPIRGNGAAGLYANGSDLVFNRQTMRRTFQLTDNGSHIYAGYGKYRFEGLDFSNAKSYGVATWHSDVSVRDCTFKGNGYAGFQSSYNKSLLVQDSHFDENNAWGLLVYGNGKYYGHENEAWGWHDADPGLLVGCTIERNKQNGLYLDGASSENLRLKGVTIHDNEDHGLLAVSCDLMFTPETMGSTWNIKGNGYGITTYYGKTHFEDIEVADSNYWGALTYYGDVTVKNCKFTRNAHGGMWSCFNKSLRAEGTTFSENGSSGLAFSSNGRYYGYKDGRWGWHEGATGGELVNCVIEKNKSYGMYLTNTTDPMLRMTNTPIRDNPHYGLYAVHCDLAFNPRTVGSKWQIKNNGHGIATHYGTTRLEDVEIADNKYWGALTYYGDVSVKNCAFTRNGHGGFWSYYNKSFLAENTKFAENGQWGLAYGSNGRYYGYKDGKWGWHDGASAGRLVNCVIERQKYHGMYVTGTSDQHLIIENTPIRNNPRYGLYAVDSHLEFTPATVGSKWKISSNGNGITTIYGTVKYDGVAIADNKEWGAQSYYGDVTINNSTFTHNGSGGFYSYFDKSFSARNSKFNENGNWGLGYSSDGRYYGYRDGKWAWHEDAKPGKIDRCTMSKNKYHGMYVDYLKNDKQLVMTNSEAADNGHIGIAFYNSAVTLSPATSGKWVSRNNGHGFHAHNCDLTVNDFEISGHRWWGINTHYSNVRLKNARLSGNGHNMYWYTEPWVHGFKHTLTVEDSVFENSTDHYGLLAYYGPVEIRNSKFRGNKGDGLYTIYNKSVAVEGSEFTGNKRWGVVYHVNYPQSGTWDHKALFKDNVQTLNNCKIDNNYYGSFVYSATNANFGLKKTDITNNQYYSLYYSHCNMVVDDQATNEWTLDGNGYGPTVVHGDVTFRNVVNKNSRHYGFLGWHGKMTLDGVSSSGSRYGFYQYRPSAATSITNSRFEGRNDEWGWGLLSYGGGVSVTNSIFASFHNGAYTHTYGDEPQTPVHNIYNNIFANLRYWGAYLPNGSATVRNNILAHRDQDAGGYGVAEAGGSLIHSHNLVHGFGAPFYRTSDPDGTTVLNNPRFVDATAGDFHLKKGSPAINSGMDTSNQVPYDMEGNRRPAYEVVEIGPYEYVKKDGSFRVLNWREKK